MVQTVQENVEMQQVQSVDMVVDMSVFPEYRSKCHRCRSVTGYETPQGHAKTCSFHQWRTEHP